MWMSARVRVQGLSGRRWEEGSEFPWVVRMGMELEPRTGRETARLLGSGSARASAPGSAQLLASVLAAALLMG